MDKSTKGGSLPRFDQAVDSDPGPVNILGLNAFHGDSAACLIRDGYLVAAAEEERFRRIKHWAGLPTQAIQYCLREAGLTLSDLDHVAINRQPRANHPRRIKFVLTHWPSPRLILEKFRNMGLAETIESGILRAFPGVPFKAHVHHVEHHLAHLTSAFLASQFEEAVCVSVDGFGDFASARWGLGHGDRIKIDERIYFPHSLGIFYSALTQYLGFPHFGDEFKVMGLAPYGQPSFLSEMRQIVRIRPDGTFRLSLRFFQHHVKNVSNTWNKCAPEIGTLFTQRLPELLGPARQPHEPLGQRHKDIARSVQAIYEEALFSLLTSLHARYQCSNLALAGGCAMNSVANGKVYLQSPFRKIYVPPAAGDAGGAIGAALAVWTELGGQRSRSKHPEIERPGGARASLSNAYTGPRFSSDEIGVLLAAKAAELSAKGCQVIRVQDFEALCNTTAEAIARGDVVGWFQGRMEWGPRALGNRSILCDPRRSDMKEILNLKIKRRESFRPFAPSILRDRVSAWFEQDDDVPFMMQVFQVRSEKRQSIPAVTHVDGSGRLQTVHAATNPRYYRLIEHFDRLTGVPIVLNTSFNENEPVVCTPQEALDCFLRTQMDCLVIEDFIIRRRNVAP